MHIRFDLPTDPAYAGRVAKALGGRYLRKYVLLGLPVLLLGLLGTVAPLFDDDPSTGPIPAFEGMAVVGVVMLLLPTWLGWAVRRRGGMSMGGPATFDITDTNVTMQRVASSNGLAWDGVDRVSESPEFWVLWVGRIPAMAVPRNVMGSDDAQALRVFLVGRGLLPA